MHPLCIHSRYVGKTTSLVFINCIVIITVPHLWWTVNNNNNNNNPIYKAPKALASEMLAAGQSWVLIKSLTEECVLSLDLNTDSESALILSRATSFKQLAQNNERLSRSLSWRMACPVVGRQTSNSYILRSVYRTDMKFYRQLRPATETSWVVSYGRKTIPRWRTAAILKIVISPYLREKSSAFDEILYTAADFELDERHVIKNEKVALDRLRVRQNVLLLCSTFDVVGLFCQSRRWAEIVSTNNVSRNVVWQLFVFY